MEKGIKETKYAQNINILLKNIVFRIFIRKFAPNIYKN